MAIFGKKRSGQPYIKTGEKKPLTGIKTEKESSGIARRVLFGQSDEQTRSEFFKKLQDRGIKYPMVEIGDEGNRAPEITLTREQTLNAINGNRTAEQIVDFATGTTQRDRLKYNVFVTNELYNLEQAGVISITDGKWMRIVKASDSR